jgi:hypothetical protein
VSESEPLEAHCTAIVQALVRERWEASGRDLGRSEPPPPTLLVTFDADEGRLEVVYPTFPVDQEQPPAKRKGQPTLIAEGFAASSCSWDGSEERLAELLEIIAEEYWGDYVDPSYKYWTPPPA